MTRREHLTVGALAAVYLLWCASWIVFGNELYGPTRYYWDQATAAAVSSLIAFNVVRHTDAPYSPFAATLGVAFALLAASWATYGRSDLDLTSDLAYASCVFALLCAWGYLALERWRGRPLSLMTTWVFVALMIGLGTIFANFYYQQYRSDLGSTLGRLDALTAAFEFAVLVAGLLCILLKEPPVVVWLLVGTVILMAGDMAYSIKQTPLLIDPFWMLGQFVLLAALVVMPGQRLHGMLASDAPSGAAEPYERSGLSGILILLSLGGVLLAPLVWLLPVAAVWKSIFAVLFVVALVTVLIWITDRLDDTVAYLRSYTGRVLESHLRSEDWRSAPHRIRAALRSTGLGAFLDEFRSSAARLKQDVLFLGPERLYAPPQDRPGRPSCFLVMPFGQEWSADVHRILARACEAAGVQPVRGDDLFTPTDILEDIWQSINNADFVIADITGRNPNVLYELGIAHALAKPVLILSRNASDIPIDLATRRVIVYGQADGDWCEELARKTSAAVAKIVADYGVIGREG